MAPALFDVVVPKNRIHPSFEYVRKHPAKASARAALEAAFATFVDPDGTFVTAFQSDGFDARVLELYLHAYFSESDFAIDRTHSRPDFIVARNGLKVAVEATTTNPSQGGVLAATAARVSDLETPSEIAEYTSGELAVRVHNALNDKLRKQYWNLEHVKGLPLVFALEPFHDPNALQLADAGVTQFLYGLAAVPSMTDAGSLNIDGAEIESHRKATKVITSGFFNRPGTEHVSAVLFTNAGTIAKFSRMGYDAGFGRDNVHIIRRGTAFDPEPSAMLPRFFMYDLDASPRRERWGEELVCVHNPNALEPLPDGYFPDAVDTRLINGEIVSYHRGWHPFASVTEVYYDPRNKRSRPLVRNALEIRAITKQAFHQLTNVAPAAALMYREEVWLADSTNSFLGVVVYDRGDGDYGYAVLAPDQTGRFRAIENDCGYATREQAALEIWKQMAQLLERPQRVFQQ